MQYRGTFKQKCQLLAGLFILAFVGGCASTPQADTDFDRDFDFSKVNSVAIQPIDRTELSDIRISDMQIERIDQALSQELANKGLNVVSDNAQADVFLVWHLVTEERTDVRSYNNMSYYNCWRCGPSVSDVSVRQYTEGTFIVDMVDPVRNQSIWRSIVKSQLKPQSGGDDAAARRAKAAEIVLSNFPPAPESN